MNSVDTSNWGHLSQLKNSLAIEWQLKQTDTISDKKLDIDRGEFLKQIETLIGGIIEKLSNGEAPVLEYTNYRDWDTVRYQEGEGLLPSNEKRISSIRYSDQKSLKKFGLIVKTLGIVYKLIQENKYCTKRDLYYQDPEAYGSQTVLDTVIDNIAAILDVPRWHLNVLATGKGLVAGDVQFSNDDGLHIDCRGTKVGVQVPAHKKDMKDMETTARFVLIVEKDATFQKLLGESFCEKYFPCILITAKGFPDLGTRLFLRSLWDQFQLPMFALVDCDPHGFEIMSVYKFGSRAHVCENRELAVPTIRWLGILPSDMHQLNLPGNSLLKMTDKDNEKTSQLLDRVYIKSNWKLERELQTMLQSGIKAEIQCLDSFSSSYLCDVYIPRKLYNGDWL